MRPLFSQLSLITSRHLILQRLQALQRTIEFEEELAEKFGSGHTKKVTSDVEESDKGETSNQLVMDIRKKYEKKLVTQQGNQDDVCNTSCLI